MQMELTLSAAGSRDRASLGPQPGSAEAQKMTVTSGRKCYELLKLSGQDGSLARMSEILFRWKWASSVAFLTWKISAMPSKHLLSVLSVSVPRTDVIGAGLWATARAQDAKHAAATEWELQTDHAGTRDSLRVQVAKRGLWPTPKGSPSGPDFAKMERSPTSGLSLPTVVAMYPTPTVGAGLCGGTGNFQQLHKLKDEGQITEDERRNMSQGNGGSLNPTWVEWLMGFPPGWTDCED